MTLYADASQLLVVSRPVRALKKKNSYLCPCTRARSHTHAGTWTTSASFRTVASSASPRNRGGSQLRFSLYVRPGVAGTEHTNTHSTTSLEHSSSKVLPLRLGHARRCRWGRRVGRWCSKAVSTDTNNSLVSVSCLCRFSNSAAGGVDRPANCVPQMFFCSFGFYIGVRNCRDMIATSPRRWTRRLCFRESPLSLNTVQRRKPAGRQAGRHVQPQRELGGTRRMAAYTRLNFFCVAFGRDLVALSEYLEAPLYARGDQKWVSPVLFFFVVFLECSAGVLLVFRLSMLELNTCVRGVRPFVFACSTVDRLLRLERLYVHGYTSDESQRSADRFPGLLVFFS